MFFHAEVGEINFLQTQEISLLSVIKLMRYFVICECTPNISNRVMCSSKRGAVNEVNALLINGSVTSKR